MLSGDLDGDDEPEFVNRDDNSYNVVRAFDTDDSPRLDGFTIVGGFAEGTGTLEDYGGAVIVYLASPTISRCTFTDNWASTGGGAAHVEGPFQFESGESVVRFFDCRFESNARHARRRRPRAGGSATSMAR